MMKEKMESKPSETTGKSWMHVASFKDLSVAYFPDIVPHNASRRLKQWIKESPALLEELYSCGWNESKRLLTPLQVGCIIRAFGEP